MKKYIIFLILILIFNNGFSIEPIKFFEGRTELKGKAKISFSGKSFEINFIGVMNPSGESELRFFKGQFNLLNVSFDKERISISSEIDLIKEKIDLISEKINNTLQITKDSGIKILIYPDKKRIFLQRKFLGENYIYAYNPNTYQIDVVYIKNKNSDKVTKIEFYDNYKLCYEIEFLEYTKKFPDKILFKAENLDILLMIQEFHLQ